ncbi:aspartoacylase [Rheinheimera sp. MMS21-TC3]|uniref:aspartoacylase n=1 Tax=Rheinheimera sp. MMS21-TC3 TaxID=3072790 RepID=UPI0028C3C863|nr:aspartoacylase [Rheinheimera sp. MMS21-TC3]WNO61223.1 aspartoacylase [Rheinheimera sp. MMS21-TC3]
MSSKTLDTIKQVAIVGGVHGNEFSGIYLIKRYQAQPDLMTRASFNTETVWANPEAHYANKRYLHSDLNRQFKSLDLADMTLANYEQSRAKVLNAQLGPKGNARTDLVIDLHNTTSNMGACLILTQAGEFYNKMAAYVKMQMPEAIISRDEDHIAAQDHALMCTLGRYGVLVEVGPQSQSVLRQDILDLMHQMTQHILDFVQLYNTNTLPKLPKKTEAYRYLHSIKLPMNEQGERLGMVHKNIQDNDYQPINPSDPLFTLFDGTVLYYEGETTVYPTFINEAAYYDNNLAMSLNEKVIITLADD